MLSKNSLALSLVLLGSALTFPTVAADKPQQQHALQYLTLDVQNMTCSMCKITVRKALEKVPGVAEAKVDFGKKLAIVKYDPSRVAAQDLIDATTNVGYPSTLHNNKNP